MRTHRLFKYTIILDLTKQYLLLIGLFFCLTTQLSAQSVSRPLDSLISVLKTLNIPEDLQGKWIESLEEYEDEQDTPAFKNALANIQEQIEAYLVNGSVAVEQQQPQPKKKNFFKKLSEKVAKVKEDIDVGVPLELAKTAEENKNNKMAIKNYAIAIKKLEEQEDWDAAIKWREHLAGLHERLGDNAAALVEWKIVVEKRKAIGKTKGLRRIVEKIKALEAKEHFVPSITPPKVSTTKPTTTTVSTPPSPKVPNTPVSPTIIQEKSIQIIAKEKAIATAQTRLSEIKRKAAKAEKERDYVASLQLTKELSAMEMALQKQKIAMEGDKRLLAENKLQLLEQEAELKEQETALAQEQAFKQNLWAGLGLSSLVALALYFMYASKQRDHKKLGIAYQELATAQHHLKDAESRVKNLLKQQLSGAVANELMATGGVQKMEQRFVCIMFLDIRDFTPFVEKLSPEEIIAYQNNVLGFMIEKVIEHNGVVNTIMGDGFMATFGAPISVGNDCLQAHRAATEIMEMVKAKSESGAIPPTRIGIGLHAGYVVAGNVGTKERKQYSITGNPVIIASRLEQLNKKYKSTMIVSKEVFEQLPVDMEKPESFDAVSVKGRTEPVEIARFF